MGLNFKILVIWKALSTMPPKVLITASGVKPSGFGSTGSKIAPPAAATTTAAASPVHPSAHSAPPPAAILPAPTAASSATCKHGTRCTGCHVCQKGGKGGKGGGASLTAEQIATQKAESEAKVAESEAKVAEARARTLRAKADAAEAEARLKSVQSTAVVASTPRARPGATSGGDDFVTREEFNEFRGQVTNGFSTVVQQNQRTHDVLAGFLQFMNGGLPASKAPVSRQICNSAQEIAEQRQISFGQNAGWDPVAERSGMSATSSSQLPQTGAATSFHYSSAHMPQSSSYFPPPNPSNGSISRSPADQRFPTSGSGHSAPAPQSLAELIQTMPETAKGFKGLCMRVISDAAKPGAKAVQQFTFHKFLYAWQMSDGNDDLACALMALTYGKPLAQQKLQPGIANALRTSDIALFTEFFRRISTQYPLYVLTYNWRGPSGQECKTPYGTFASDQNFLRRFIYEHILA